MGAKKINIKNIIKVALIVVASVAFGAFVRSCINAQTADQFVVLSTADMNGRVWDKDIQTGESSPNNMMAVSTVVKGARSEFGDRVVAYDAGDLYQESLIDSLGLSHKKSDLSKDVNPSTIAMDEIKYDGYTLGNHEFDYKYSLLRTNYEYIKDYTTLVSANVYDKNGNRLLTPYITKTFKVDGEFLKVGIIGLENPDCSLWDASSHYSDIQFYAPENKNADLAYEIKKVQEEMNFVDEKCDFVIVSMHNGFYFEDEMKGAKFTQNTQDMLDERLAEPLVMGENTEAQAYRAIKNTTGIDMFICGHDQNNNYSNMTFANADGSKDVLVVNAAGTSVTKSVIQAKYNKNEHKYDINIKDSININLDSTSPDEVLRGKVLPYIQNDLDVFANRSAKIVGDWTVNENDLDYYTEQTDFADFINRAQMWAGNSVAKNTSKTVEDINLKLRKANGENTNLQFKGDSIGVDMSLTSIPQASNKKIQAGDFDYQKAKELFPEDYYLCSVALTGAEIKEILEYNASVKYQVQDDEYGNHKVVVNGDLRGLPIAYGLNFTLDLTAPIGQRAKIEGFSNGKQFNLNDVYCVMVNSNIIDSTSSYIYAMLTWDRVLIDQDLNHDGTFIRHILDLYATQSTEDYGGVYPTSDSKKDNEKPSSWSLNF